MEAVHRKYAIPYSVLAEARQSGTFGELLDSLPVGGPR
jgi:hypothetical protein